MKASRKKKTTVAARHAKRRLENPLTEAQKVGQVATEAERQRKIQWTAKEKCERARPFDSCKSPHLGARWEREVVFGRTTEPFMNVEDLADAIHQ